MNGILWEEFEQLRLRHGSGGVEGFCWERCNFFHNPAVSDGVSGSYYLVSSITQLIIIFSAGLLRFLQKEDNRRDVVYDIHSGGCDDHGLVQLRSSGAGLHYTNCQWNRPHPTDCLLLLLLQFYHGKSSDRQENVSDLPTAGPCPDLHCQWVRSWDSHLQDWSVRSLGLSQLLPGPPGQYPARPQEQKHRVSTLHPHPRQCHHDWYLEPVWKHHQRLFCEDSQHDGFHCGDAAAEPVLLLPREERVQGHLCDMIKTIQRRISFEQIFKVLWYFCNIRIAFTSYI